MPQRSFTVEGVQVDLDHILGFAVMACHFDGRVGLAFCSPVDRARGRWSRDEGVSRCADRVHYEATTLVHHASWTVRDYVVDAVLRGHAYVPDLIRIRIRRGARAALVLC